MHPKNVQNFVLPLNTMENSPMILSIWWETQVLVGKLPYQKILMSMKNIYSSNLTPERTDSRKNKTFWGTTFHFPRSTGQLSAERSEARQSWRSRKGKSSPKTSFVLTRIQFPSGVRWGDTLFHSIWVCSTKRSKIATPFKNLNSKFSGVPLKIAGCRLAIFQQKVAPRAAVDAAAIAKWLLCIDLVWISLLFLASIDS